MRKRKVRFSLEKYRQAELENFARQYWTKCSDIAMIEEAAQAVAGDDWEALIDVVTADKGGCGSLENYRDLRRKFFVVLDAIREQHDDEGYRDRKPPLEMVSVCRILLAKMGMTD